jgi:rRNA-processing protein FCF1
LELGKRLTDKTKLAIIETIKKELERAVKKHKKNPNKEIGKPCIRFYKKQFTEIDEAWLKDLYGHFGVRVSFDL